MQSTFSGGAKAPPAPLCQCPKNIRSVEGALGFCFCFFLMGMGTSLFKNGIECFVYCWYFVLLGMENVASKVEPRGCFGCLLLTLSFAEARHISRKKKRVKQGRTPSEGAKASPFYDVCAYLDCRMSPRKHGMICKTRLTSILRYALSYQRGEERCCGFYFSLFVNAMKCLYWASSFQAPMKLYIRLLWAFHSVIFWFFFFVGGPSQPDPNRK